MRVIVVDDSTLFRKIVRDSIAFQPGIEVVGSAPNGRLALEKIEQLRPDVVTLDVEMPELDGIEVLRRLREQQNPPIVLMISSQTSTGAALTARALALGAFDYVLKPQGSDLEANLRQLRTELPPKLRLAAEAREKFRSHEGNDAGAAALANNRSSAASHSPTWSLRPGPTPEIIAIGVSTGGPAALAQVLGKLPAEFPLPIVVVQHMPPMFTRSLANELDRICPMNMHEAADGESLRPGNVYIAPGGCQMKIAQGSAGRQISITDDAPEKSCKPSIDYLFRSLAHLYGSKTLAIVMTGMGDDGTLGCKLLKRYGARIVAQNEASCVVYGMPRRVVESGLADLVCPLHDLHHTILDSVRLGVAPCS